MQFTVYDQKKYHFYVSNAIENRANTALHQCEAATCKSRNIVYELGGV